MTLPHWLSKTRPIIQRELAVWARYRLVIRIFVGGFALLCALSLISDLTTIFAPEAYGYLFLFIQSLPGTLAVLTLKIILLAVSAASVAREVESNAWEALRLTDLRPGHILAGKGVAVIRLFGAPILIWIGLNSTITLVFLGKRWVEASADLNNVLLFLFFLVFDILSPCAIAGFWVALGLLISTLVSTQAKAVIGALAVFGALIVAGWIAELIYRVFINPRLLGGVETALLEFGWVAGWALLLFKAAEWRVATGLKSLF
ncbi:MAG TPA: hypothetical protein VI547_06445 [Anaerolineales bacterium]|nr:hypothetical protein [Anaerolineales bacterium]